MKLSLSEIVQACNAQILKGITNENLYEFSTDTRTIKSGQVYIPLKGESFDGENFIDKALENGANGYLTSNPNKLFNNAEFILLVKDTKEAYLQLANYYKNKINPYTIAITGSSGKTTVKEMMYSVFKNADNTIKSILNHNNEVGLCQTLSALEENTKYLIIEMGMRGLGEIELLSKYSEPDIAVIVNSGSAHIGRLGSLLNIAKAKFEIAKYLKPNGILIAHNNPLIKEVNDNKHETFYFDLEDKNLKIIEMTSNTCLFEYKNQEYKLNVGGEHNIQNALSVIEAGLFAGLSTNIIAKGLEEFSPIEKRWDIEVVDRFNIINDSYNSNPESVKAALKTFLKHTPSPKIVVLGDMGELGLNEEEYHKETGIFLENFECDYVLTTGDLAKYIQPKNLKTIHFETKKELADFIKNNLPKGANLLLKASRFMKFEEIIEELKK
ncbi:MAG: UDP-N-acetylmuramoyl-tripeptide--D-alanyl-D-alanine ligase [Cyanobacteria bacterium SIG29]|nr:UDP-N-acetylmuramoyl-tripeptide--D-alanyl-D-alanine ligase [Cyanobacteria bacterium SIG29]